MKAGGRAATILLALPLAWIMGCAAPPPVPATSPIAVPTPPQRMPADLAEAAYRERAEALTREGRWADALAHWELLMLLRPDSAEYRDRAAQVELHIRETVRTLLKEVAEVRRRGNLDQAVARYLRILSMDRHNLNAAEGLREIERERMRRAYLNRPPRF